MILHHYSYILFYFILQIFNILRSIMGFSNYESQRDIEKRIICLNLADCMAYAHFHSSIELFYVQKGRFTFRSLNKNQILEEGMIAYVPSLHTHTILSLGSNDGPAISKTVIIPPNYLTDFNKMIKNPNYCILDDVEFNNAKLLPLFFDIEKNMSKQQPSLILQGNVDTLLGLVSEHYEPSEFHEKNNDFAIEIIKYIEQNFKSQIKLDTIAEYFSFNRCYFSRLFKNIFNSSLNEYVNSIRLSYVLQNTDKEVKITDLIHEAGFNETSSFYRCYSKYKNNFNFKPPLK